MKQRRNSIPSFFFSILTALVAGLAIGFVIILSFQAVFRSIDGRISDKALVAESGTTTPVDAAAVGLPAPFPVTSATIDNEEGTEDPQTLQDLSQVLDLSKTPSNVNGDEVIETAQGLLSKSQAAKKISADAYSVTDLATGEILLQKNTTAVYPIASLTKLVTAVMAKKVIPENQHITITSSDLSTEGNTGNLKLGEKYTVAELLYPMLMVSSNDAAEAFAQSYGRTKFLAQMNSWVQSIGATHTHFSDASGLSPKNVSTAHDIAVITEWIHINMPELFEITGTKTKTIRLHTWINPTYFLNLTAYVGGKNGYTPEAEETGVSLFSLGSPKQLYSVVVLDSVQRDVDTLNILAKALK